MQSVYDHVLCVFNVVAWFTACFARDFGRVARYMCSSTCTAFPVHWVNCISSWQRMLFWHAWLSRRNGAAEWSRNLTLLATLWCLNWGSSRAEATLILAERDLQNLKLQSRFQKLDQYYDRYMYMYMSSEYMYMCTGFTDMYTYVHVHRVRVHTFWKTTAFYQIIRVIW